MPVEELKFTSRPNDALAIVVYITQDESGNRIGRPGNVYFPDDVLNTGSNVIFGIDPDGIRLFKAGGDGESGLRATDVVRINASVKYIKRKRR